MPLRRKAERPWTHDGAMDAQTAPASCKTAPTRFRTSAHRHHLLDQEPERRTDERSQISRFSCYGGDRQTVVPSRATPIVCASGVETVGSRANECRGGTHSTVGRQLRAISLGHTRAIGRSGPRPAGCLNQSRRSLPTASVCPTRVASEKGEPHPGITLLVFLRGITFGGTKLRPEGAGERTQRLRCHQHRSRRAPLSFGKPGRLPQFLAELAEGCS